MNLVSEEHNRRALYDANYYFVPNPINRYTVSQRNKLKANADGSVDLYVQNESPGKDKEQKQ